MHDGLDPVKLEIEQNEDDSFELPPLPDNPREYDLLEAATYLESLATMVAAGEYEDEDGYMLVPVHWVYAVSAIGLLTVEMLGAFIDATTKAVTLAALAEAEQDN